YVVRPKVRPAPALALNLAVALLRQAPQRLLVGAGEVRAHAEHLDIAHHLRRDISAAYQRLGDEVVDLMVAGEGQQRAPRRNVRAFFDGEQAAGYGVQMDDAVQLIKQEQGVIGGLAERLKGFSAPLSLFAKLNLA